MNADSQLWLIHFLDPDASSKRIHHGDPEEVKRLRAERTKLEDEIRQLSDKQNRLREINAILGHLGSFD